MTKFIEGAREIEMDAVAKNGKVSFLVDSVVANKKIQKEDIRSKLGHVTILFTQGMATLRCQTKILNAIVSQHGSTVQ